MPHCVGNLPLPFPVFFLRQTPTTRFPPITWEVPLDTTFTPLVHKDSKKIVIRSLNELRQPLSRCTVS